MSKLSSSIAVIGLTFSLAPIAFADEPATPTQGANTSQTPAPAAAAAPAAAPMSSGDSSVAPASSEAAAPSQEPASHANAAPTNTANSPGSAAPRQDHEETSQDKPAQPTAAPQTQNADDRIICKRMEVTGTRLRKGKVCKPLSEWRAAEAAARGLLDDASKRGAPQPGGQTLPTG